MRVIHKESIPLHETTTTLHLPEGSQIVAVGCQQGVPVIWYSFDEMSMETEERMFFVVGTGHYFPLEWIYVGTCFDGGLVWHIHEKPRVEETTNGT